MKILYENTKLQKSCNDDTAMRREYGELTQAIKRRLQDLEGHATIDEWLQFGLGHPEPLSGDLPEHFSARLSGNKRIIFRPAPPIPRRPDKSIETKQTTTIIITHIGLDYHGK